MKKKVLSVLVLLLAIIITLNCHALAQENIRVFVDGVQVEFDEQPQLIGGRAMVPLRATFNALGASVIWDEESQTITAYNEAYIVRATVNQMVMTVNGEERQMDIAPMIVGERTLVPIRFIAESFNCNVVWDGDGKIITVTTREIDYNSLEKGNSSDKKTTSGSSATYYKGTKIPTYTSITGVKLKDKKIMESGTTIYMYRYTDSDDVGDYWKALSKMGWELYLGDDKATQEVFETCFVNGDDLMLVYVYLDFDEVWITF